MRILVLGLTITSSWGNGHATTYRALLRALGSLGHSILFVEKDVEWYRADRDMPKPTFCALRLYSEWPEMEVWLGKHLTGYDLVIVGSYFPDGVAAGDFLFRHKECPVMFYDIDTPITLEALFSKGGTEAIHARQIPCYDAYLSFTGGPSLELLRSRFGARFAFPLYCSVDEATYRPQGKVSKYESDLSYLGTYSADRQPKLVECLLRVSERMPGGRFLIAGAQYPQMELPRNVRHIQHVPPADHPAFYSSSRFTLNLTRDAMVRAGYSPSVRLFEAAACGAAILSDQWPGLGEFFALGEEILVAEDTAAVEQLLRDTSEAEIRRLGERARARVLSQHTSLHRAQELEAIYHTVTHADRENDYACTTGPAR